MTLFMQLPFFEQRSEKGINFQQTPLPLGEYEDCQFIQCNLEGLDLSGYRFTNCLFKDCNLSLVQVHQTAFRSACFDACKILGVHFEDANPFGLEFQFLNCQLDNSSFVGISLKDSRFEHCQLQQVDFTESDLRKIHFIHCDFEGAQLENCQLQETDFRSSYHYTLDPSQNKLKKTRFSQDGLKGLLTQFDLLISD